MKSLVALLLLVLWLPAAAVAQAAVGNPVIYHSPDGSGARPGTTPILTLADNEPLHLFIDYDNVPDEGASSGAGTMCVNEDGDETCGFDALIVMQTDSAVFDSFTPAGPGIVGRIDPVTLTSFRVNGIDTSGMAIPAPIGTLIVDAAGADEAQIVVNGVHRVGAAGQLDAIQPLVIVPEPGRHALLCSGLIALAALSGLRRRRPRARC